MNNNGLLEKISSEYLVRYIFDFLDEKKKLKLINNSKKFQKILDFNIYDYFEKYLNKSKITFDDFLISSTKEEILPSKLKEKNIDLNFINSYISYFWNKNKEKYLKQSNENLINIYIKNPYLDIFAGLPFFEKICTIIIPLYYLNRNNLLEQSFQVFNRATQSKFAFKFNKIDDINYFKNNKIILNQINKAILNLGFENTLITLEIDFPFVDIFPNTSEKINNLKCLEELVIKRFMFSENFYLKLNTLKYLEIERCEKIGFDENMGLNLETLIIYNTPIIVPNKLIKFNKLKTLKIEDDFGKDYNFNLIDFQSLNNLKRILEIEEQNFLKLGEIQLEFAKINPSIRIDEETEKLVLEKLLSLKAIKESAIKIKNLNNKIAEEIHGENTSLNKLKVIYYDDNYDSCAINKLLKKFKNLNDLDLYMLSLNNNKKINIDIRENTDYKIDKIRVRSAGSKDIIIYCNSFENLIYLDINLDYEILNTIELPLFNNKKIVYKSLRDFRFDGFECENDITLEMLNNLYINIDNAPSLENFIISGISKSIDKKTYFNFIKKILRLKKMKVIYIFIYIEKIKNSRYKTYSSDEIKEILNDNNDLSNLENKVVHIILK
jgi:hypothetical protein